MHRAEEEAADARNALQKVQNFLTRSLGDCNENIIRKSLYPCLCCVFVVFSQSRKCVLDLSSSESVLRYELREGRNCLDQMAVINSALLLDKRELNRQLLEVALFSFPYYPCPMQCIT